MFWESNAEFFRKSLMHIISRIMEISIHPGITPELTSSVAPEFSFRNSFKTFFDEFFEKLDGFSFEKKNPQNSFQKSLDIKISL